MRLVITSIVALFMFVGCNITTQDAPHTTHVNVIGLEGKSEVKLGIEGMMCVKGCAAKIKKELLEIEGVSSVRIDFEDERKINYAIVDFNTKTTEIDALYKQVNNIADGKLYGVTSMDIIHYMPEEE